MADYERIVRRWFAPGARMPTALIRTERGDITLELLAVDAPLVVDAFIGLANKGYYRNTWFHRVVPNFVAQDGDPRGDGSGGPGFTLRDAYTRQRHERGCLGLATSGPDTGGSQYYMCHSPQPHLDGHYTVLGRVRRGFETLDAIVQGDRVFSVEIR
jgi:cyclophilin family peptidyl-prolyl cis-trans isomerase